MTDKIELSEDKKTLFVVDTINGGQYRKGFYVASFSLFKDCTEMSIQEESDNYYKSKLNKKEFQEFINELQNLANMMPDKIDDNKEE